MSALLKHALGRSTRISTMSTLSMQQSLYACSLFLNMKNKPITMDERRAFPLQKRLISSSLVLNKRKGGNSAFVVKSHFYKKKSTKKKHKLKKDTAPHKTHLDQIRQLKSIEKENERNKRIWDALDKDEELHREYDEVFKYLMNLGPESDYIYHPEQSLKDLDEKELLTKLNALITGEEVVEVEENQENPEETKSLLAQVSVDDYNFLLRVYAVKGLHQEANAILSRMERNLDTPILSVSTTMELSSDETTLSSELLTQLDQVPQHTIAPNDHSYMYYICSLTKSKQAALAVRTLGRMKSKGIYPSVNTYNSVMNVCAKADRIQWSYNIMEKMQLAGLTPNNASFTILMNAAIQKNEIDKAFETFNLMRTYVEEPDVVAFTSLIHGFAKIGRVEKAINLMEDMLENGLTPTQVTFNALMHACAKSRHFAHKAIDFYYEMQELYDYIPDLYTYNTMLYACGINGDIIQAENILADMEKHQVPKDEITYNTMLNTYARAQIKSIVDRAPRNQKPLSPPEPIFQRPLEYDDDGKEIDLTRPGKETYSMENINYDATFDEEEEEEEEYDDDLSPEELAELEKLRLEDMEEELDTTACTNAKDNTTVDALEQVTHVDDVDDVDEEEDEFNLKPMDLSDFGAFQNLNIAKAEKLFEEISKEESNVVVTRTTLNSLLNVYANALRLYSSDRVVRELFPKYGLTPDMYTYRALMRMHLRSKRIPKAEELLETLTQKIQNEEIRGDSETFGLVVDFYARRQNLRRALQVLETMDHFEMIPHEKHLKSIRKLSERYGIYTELIPEDPDAVILAGSRHKLMAKRKMRAQVIAYNQKKGKKYLLPESF